MLRNDLINLLAEHDNDAVAVDINNIHVDVTAVLVDHGILVLVLDPESMRGALSRPVEHPDLEYGVQTRPNRTNSRWAAD